MPKGFWVKGKKREKEGFMHIIKQISVSRFYLCSNVSISSGIFVAPKMTIQFNSLKHKASVSFG